MAELARVLDEHVERGTAPWIIAARGIGDAPPEILTAGDVGPDAVVRIQSMTKPVTAVATLRLVQPACWSWTPRSTRGCPSWRIAACCARRSRHSTTRFPPAPRSRCGTC